MDYRNNDGLRMFFMLLLVATMALMGAACDNGGGGGKTETDCTGGVDNDGDGLTDCDDPDCDGDAACQAGNEICDDTIDNDEDTLTDCDDPDCDGDPACPADEICDDEQDNDEDGDTDCDDDDCLGDAACQTTGEDVCDDNIDNDSDGATDCEDTECAAEAHCMPESICDDETDNDLDGATDCDDSDCDGDAACQAAEICDDEQDNDEDGDTDCDDDDCLGHANCQTTGEDVCDDNIDNDSDGATDCEDTECAAEAHCMPETICDDNTDNDLDGDTDCDDTDCAEDVACAPDEICDDEQDNDQDGDTDCDDPDCLGDAACQTTGEDVCDDNIDNDSDGATDCDDTECAAEVYCQPETDCTDEVDNDLDGDTDCDDTDCADDLACELVEICDDEQDNDEDGDTDCDDDDCLGDAACQTTGEDVCDDNIDNDSDGATDCEDTECAAEVYCQPETVCDDSTDNDLDGDTDCDDSDCTNDPYCTGTCPDDQYEPNEDLASAVPLAVGSYSLYMCNDADDQNDWFSADLAAGETIAVGIDFVHADLDIELRLRDAADNSLDDSNSSTDREEVFHTSAAGETVYIRVDPFRAGSAPYAMQIIIDPGCTEDGDCQTGEICNMFTCQAGCRYDSSCADGEICEQYTCIAGCRYDSECSDGEICEQDSCVTGCRNDIDCLAGEVCLDTQCITPECLGHADCGAGQVCDTFYCVDVTCDATTDPCADYGLLCDLSGGTCVECLGVADCPNDVDFVCSNGWCSLNCSEDSFEPNSAYNAAAALNTLPVNEQGLTLCGESDEDWFTVYATEGNVYTIDLTFVSADGDIDLYLYDDQANELASSEYGVDGEHLLVVAPADGTYYIGVHLYTSGVYTHTYDLDIVDLGAMECSDHPECSAGQLCEDYFCIDFACDATAPCPTGLVCDLTTNECVGCLTVADCPDTTNYTCDNNWCAFDCDEDSYEPNSVEADAAGISLPFIESGLTLCGAGNEDWFVMTLEENHVYAFDIMFANADGDIDLYLYHSSDTANYLERGYTGTDNESFVYAVPAGETGDYYVRVDPFSSTQLSYTYDASFQDLGVAECQSDGDCLADQYCINYTCVDCLPDMYEPNGDDQSAAAMAVPGNEAGLTLCGEDSEDWFAVDLTADTIYTIDAMFTHAAGNISLYIYAPGYTSLTDYDEYSSSYDDNEQIVYPVTAAGTYLVRVRLYDGVTQTYDLSIAATGTVECWDDSGCLTGQFCIDYTCTDCVDDAHEPNIDVASASVITVPFSETRLTLCGEDAEDWFEVNLTEDTIYTFDLSFLHDNGNIDLRIYRDGSTSSAGYSISYTDDESITYVVPTGEGGIYHIRVQLYSGIMQEYDMTVANNGAVQCYDHPDCRQGEICEDYQCSAYACDATNVCPTGLYCEPGNQWCVECLDVSHCPNDLDFTCVSFACELDCLADSYEPNSTAGDAFRVTGLPLDDTGLTLCGEDAEDWFELTLTENTVYTFDALFLHDEGNIQMRLYRAGFTDMYDDVEDSLSYDDNEGIVYAVPMGTTDTYYLRLYNYSSNDYIQTYDLYIADQSTAECILHSDCAAGQICESYQCVDYMCDVDNPCPTDLVCDDTAGACVECLTDTDCATSDFMCTANQCVLDCVEDTYEQNDVSADAAALSLPVAEAGLTLCGSADEDWFTIDLAADTTYTIDALFIHADNDIDVYLYHSSDLSTYLVRGYTSSDNENLVWDTTSTGAGTYYVMVHLFSTSSYTQTYDLNIAAQ